MGFASMTVWVVVSSPQLLLSLTPAATPKGPRGSMPSKHQSLESLGFKVIEVPFLVDQLHLPYAEAASHVLEAYKQNTPILVRLGFRVEGLRYRSVVYGRFWADKNPPPSFLRVIILTV